MEIFLPQINTGRGCCSCPVWLELSIRGGQLCLYANILLFYVNILLDWLQPFTNSRLFSPFLLIRDFPITIHKVLRRNWIPPVLLKCVSGWPLCSLGLQREETHFVIVIKGRWLSLLCWQPVLDLISPKATGTISLQLSGHVNWHGTDLSIYSFRSWWFFVRPSGVFLALTMWKMWEDQHHVFCERRDGEALKDYWWWLLHLWLHVLRFQMEHPLKLDCFSKSNQTQQPSSPKSKMSSYQQLRAVLMYSGLSSSSARTSHRGFVSLRVELISQTFCSLSSPHSHMFNI